MMCKKWLFILCLLVCCSYAEASVIAKHIMTIESGLTQASDVAVNKRGDIYVLDGLTGRVAVFDSKGEPVSVFGEKGSGDGELHFPVSVEVQGERVYISDTGNSRIMVFAEDGRFLNKIELPKLSEPTGLMVQDNTITWSDRKSHRLCRTSLDTGKTMACWGGKGEEEGKFLYPLMIDSDLDGYHYVVDVLNARVQYFNVKGSHFGSISRFGMGPGTLFRPHGIAVGSGKRVFISDSYTGRVSIFRNDIFEGILSGPDGKELIFDAVGGIAVREDRIYITKTRSGTLEVFRLIEKKGGEARQKGETPSRKNCVTCHASWSTDYSQEERDRESPVLPEASLRMCDSCHNGNVIDSRAALGSGHQHPDIHYKNEEEEKIRKRREERGDKTPKEFPLVKGELYCGSCHTPHKEHEGKDKNLWMRGSNSGRDICNGCHDSYVSLSSLQGEGNGGDVEKKKRVINHPIGISLSVPPPGADKKLYASTELLQKGLPVPLLNKGGLLDGKNRMVCQTCHGIHGTEGEGLLLMKNERSDLCTTCHADIDTRDRKDARKKGIHPAYVEMEKEVKFGTRQVKTLTCLTCHSIHDGRERSPLLRKDVDADSFCTPCHERHNARDKKDAAEKGVHPVNMELEKPVKIGDREIRKITCISCHSVHKGRRGTPSLVDDYIDGSLCSYCHKNEKEVARTDHDLGFTAGTSLNRLDETPDVSGVCGACHTMHRGKKGLPFLYAGKSTPPSPLFNKEGETTRDSLCLDCHRKKGIAEKKEIEHYTHPYKDLVLRSTTSVFPLFSDEWKKSEFGTIRCVTCHDPHRWEPSSSLPLLSTLGEREEAVRQGSYKDGDGESLSRGKVNREGTVLNSFLRSKGPQATFCVDCHGMETRLKYKYYHDKKVRDAGIDYIK